MNSKRNERRLILDKIEACTQRNWGTPQTSV